MTARRPVRVPDLVAAIVTSSGGDRELAAAAAEFGAEDARFNTWVLQRKGRSTTAEHWHLAALADAIVDDIHAAWRHLVTAAEVQADEIAPTAARRELLRRLRSQTTRMRHIRQTDRIELTDHDLPVELRDEPQS